MLLNLRVLSLSNISHNYYKELGRIQRSCLNEFQIILDEIEPDSVVEIHIYIFFLF